MLFFRSNKFASLFDFMPRHYSQLSLFVNLESKTFSTSTRIDIAGATQDTADFPSGETNSAFLQHALNAVVSFGLSFLARCSAALTY